MMPETVPLDLSLRPTTRVDLPILFAMQSDRLANERAGVKVRDRATFDARWEDVLRDPEIVPRVIVVAGQVVGSIDVITQAGATSIGYWIERKHWGRGIATRAIGLMIREVKARPLVARAAAFNTVSLRALARNGFVEVGRERTPETERIVKRETVTMRLD